MKSLDAEKGNLEFVLGTGWLSRYEASRLGVGIFVRTSRLAGTGYELRLNGERIAEASALALDRDLGPDGGKRRTLWAQIQRMERESLVQPEPSRGEDLMELLPFSVVLGSAGASVEDLSGLGRTSVIDLGIDADDAQKATLFVAGMRAAKGIVSVVGESMGLRITSVEASFGERVSFRTTGNLVDPSRSSEKLKDYNFRMPDCFTRVQLETFASIHSDFLRSLGAFALRDDSPNPGETDRRIAPDALGALAGARLTLIDQLNFTEFVDTLSEGESIVAAPCSQSARPRVAETDRPKKPLIRLAQGGGNDDEALECVRKEQERPMGGSVLASGRILETAGEAVFAALRDAWKGYGALSPRPADYLRHAPNGRAADYSAYADEYEMIALACFDLGPSGTLRVAYPLRAIEGVLKALSA